MTCGCAVLLGWSAFSCSASDAVGPKVPDGHGGGGGEDGQNGTGAQDGEDRDLGTFATCRELSSSSATVSLANFEEGLVTVQAGGPLVAYDDGSAGRFLWETEKQGANSTLHVTAQDFEQWSGFGIDVGTALGEDMRCAFDARSYVGVRFRARGKGSLRLRAATVGTLPTVEGGTCKAGEPCYDQPGTYLNLTDEMQTFEIPFCGMRIQGWGIQEPDWDPAELVGLHFVIQSFRQANGFELWLDDLELYSAESAQEELDCQLACPLESVPVPENIVPDESYLPLSNALTLANFEQPTTSCGRITRRYLSYVPTSLTLPTDAPIVLLLHGYGANAESSLDTQTHGRLNEIAEEAGFIVVYGNAAPGSASSSDPAWQNTGAWRSFTDDDREVDDVDYLRRVLADLKQRGLSAGENDVFLAGLSNGGGMTLRAAQEMTEELSGIAAFMPYVGSEAPAVPDLSSSSLSHVLFVYSTGDPGLAPIHDILLPQQPAIWAKALGLLAAETSRVSLPNLVEEGEDYEGNLPIIMETRDSSVTQVDYGDTESAAVRVFVLDHAGHFLPSPVADSESWIAETWGLRNQDIDASEVMWEFFKSRPEK